MAHSLKQQVLTDNEYTQVIQEIADEMSKDCAVPEHFLISKSKAALSKCNEAKADAVSRGEAEVAMDEGCTVRSKFLVRLRNLVISEVFGVKFSVKKSIFQNCPIKRA